MNRHTFTICGSGFGLYGYLPALAKWGAKVVLQKSYEETVIGRPELAGLAGDIAWIANLDQALAASTGAILALPPRHQTAMLERCLALRNIECVLLEKPLAVDPAQANLSLAKLERSGKRFEIGYSFLHTSWFDSLQAQSRAGEKITIDWQFMAHHFANAVSTWKRHDSQGGGVLRYFGIHLLAVMASLGFENVRESSVRDHAVDESRAWDCVLEGPGLEPCRLHVDSQSRAPRFTVTGASNGVLTDLPDPFASEHPVAPLDPRVPVLLKLLRCFDSREPTLGEVYNRVNRLWAAAERALPTFFGASG